MPGIRYLFNRRSYRGANKVLSVQTLKDNYLRRHDMQKSVSANNSNYK
jgi:hypothetical protein